MKTLAAAMAVLAGGTLVWRDRAPLPLARAGYMAGIVDGRLVVAGGSYWQAERKHWTARVDIYDPGSDTWMAGPEMPAPRSDAACVVVNNALYVFGGGAENTAQRDALVLRGGKWTALPGAGLPAARCYAVAVASGRQIYVTGGQSNPADYSSALGSFWMLDSSRPADGWKDLPPIPGPGRFVHAAAALNGRIYVFGGAADAGKDVRNLNDAYAFEIKTQRWTRLPDLPVARRAWWATAFQGRILLLGGYSNDFSAEIFSFSPATGRVSVAGTLPHPICDAMFLELQGAIIGSGGESGNHVRGEWTMGGRAAINP